MKRLLRWSVRLALLSILAAVATPFLVPMDRLMPHLLPQIEQRLSQLSGRPVTIGRLRLELLPQPALRAEGISLWPAPQSNTPQGELFIRHMAIQPDLGRLLFEQVWVLRGIVLRGVALNEDFIRGLAIPQHAGPAPLQIESLQAENLTIRLNNGRVLGPYRIHLTLGPENALQRLAAARMDGNLRLQLTQAPAGYALRLDGRRWTLPLGPALHFDTLEASGRLTHDGLTLSHWIARTYGGKVNGKADLHWQDGWRLTARLKGADIAMAPVIRLFGGSGFEGLFHGELDITLQAPRLADLLRTLLVEGPFRITAGSIGDTTAPLLTFMEFNARGRLDRDGIETWDNRLQAYDGIIAGDHLTLRWHPQWTLTGHLTADGIDSEALLAGFLDQKTVAGRFSGQADIRLQGKHFSALFTRPRLTGKFRLQEGILYRTDLKKAGTSLGKDSKGQTPFNDLQAKISMAEGRIEVEDLTLISNVLQASGRLRLDPDEHLSGHLDVGLKHTGLITSIPLVITGSRADPHLRPSKAALLGGVAGSGLMGPGLGTALGIKLGDTMDRLTRKLRRWRTGDGDPN